MTKKLQNRNKRIGADMKELKDMTLDELMLYRAAVEAYGTSRELYEVSQMIIKKREEEK